MRTVDQEKKGMFERLQSLDERMKQRVLITATCIIMVVVVYLWLGYFNNLVASFSEPAPVAQTEDSRVQTQDQAGNTSWMAAIYNQFANGARNLGNILQAPRQYIVKPPQ